MKADLHIHTTISDGSYGIEAIIGMAKVKGLTHLGITNHDTVQGLGEMMRIGREEHITIIPGIEISAYDQKRKKKVHLLGYGFDLEAPHIKAICEPLLEARNAQTLWQLDKVMALGYQIDPEAVLGRAAKSGVCYKQHIMAELMLKGYSTGVYDTLYQQLFKGNGVCQGDIVYIPVEEALAAIKRDHGIAVLAHPGQLDSYELIPELAQQGLDGIEYNHKDHTKEDKARILASVKADDLLLTGGSDFHGAYGPAGECLGSHLAPWSERLGKTFLKDWFQV
ncbi:MAG: PHP domain-containing protein [Cellulosilyticaceae bacterium]